MTKTPRIRFSFQILQGPSKGLVCGGWRVWTHAEDTYITAKSLRDTWKVSLHGESWWACAVTKENSRRPDTILPTELDRSVWTFRPTPFVDGRRLAFAIAVCRHGMLSDTVDPAEEIIEVPDRWDRITIAAVRMTEPGAAPDPSWSIVGEPLHLASGRTVWVTQSTESIEPTQPEPTAAGALIRPLSPETSDVTAPGWLVTGVHIR